MSDNKKTEIYRYYADLRHGSFIYVTKDDDNWPPSGYPVVRIMEEEVEKFLVGEPDEHEHKQ